MKFRLVFLFFISFGTCSFAADSLAFIKGMVFDLNTREALPATNVFIDNHIGTIAGKDGSYTLSSQPGTVRINFRYIGYKTVSREIKLISGETFELDMGMQMEVTELDQIVITAGKVEQRISDLTVSMSVIKPEAFSNSHISDAQEIITKSSGIEVMDGQASIRGGSGFSYGAGSRVMALIDGLPMLSADAGNIKWQFLPLESLNQIEVIKGASSVLYGSSAINGIINFRTADAGNEPETKFHAETGFYNKPANKDWVWWNSPLFFSSASFSHLQKMGNSDVGISSGILIDNGYRKRNDEKLGRLNIKLKHYNQKKEGLVYGLNMNAGYTNKMDFVLWENAETGALKQAESSSQQQYGSFLAIDPYVSFTKKGRYQHEFRSRIQSTTNDFPRGARNNSDAVSVFAEYQLFYSFSEYFSLNTGFSETFSLINSALYKNHSGLNLGVFSQAEISLIKNLKMVAGLRIENNSLDGVTDQLVPLFRSGLNYKLHNYTFLRASFGQGYRYPSIAEKHAATTLGSVRIYPNRFIQPESGWSSEIGIKQGFQGRSISGQADLALFYSRNSDMIEYLFGIYSDPQTGDFDFGFRAANVEESRVYGYEIEFMLKNNSGRFSNTLAGGYVYMYPAEINNITNQNSGVFLKYRRKHSARLVFSSAVDRFELGLSLYAKSPVLNIDNVFLDELTRESILPGFYDYWKNNNSSYALLDGNLGYKLSEKYRLSLAVKNVFNTEYMGRPGDIMPQRNLSLRFSGKF